MVTDISQSAVRAPLDQTFDEVKAVSARGGIPRVGGGPSFPRIHEGPANVVQVRRPSRGAHLKTPLNPSGGEAERSLRGVETFWIDRGGEATFHGPGQLVGYPLLSLGRPDGAGQIPRADYTGYLRRLEEVLIGAALEFGLVAGQMTGHTGIWVQPDIASRCPRCPPEARKSPAKLASIGVKIDSRGVTRHGFALNVDPDMSYWEGIVACGEPGRPSVSFAQLLEPVPDPSEVRRSVIRSFGRVFGFQMVTRPNTAPPVPEPTPTPERSAQESG